MHLHNEEEYIFREYLNDFNIYDLLDKFPNVKLFIMDEQDNFYEVSFKPKYMKSMRNGWSISMLWLAEIRENLCIYHKIETHEFDRKKQLNKPDLVYLSFGESSKIEEKYPEYMSGYYLWFAPYGFVICENS